MLIVNQVLGNVDRILFDLNARDGCTEPYILLKNRLEKIGCKFEGLKQQKIESISAIIYWDANSRYPKKIFKSFIYKLKMKLLGGYARNIEKEVFKNNKKIYKILVLMEPTLITKENSDFNIHNEMDIIFTWSPRLFRKEKYYQFYLPGPNHDKLDLGNQVPFSEKKLLVDISSNKKNRNKGSNSVERIEAIKFFSSRCDTQFDLFGSGWNKKLTIIDILTGKKGRIFNEKIKSYRGKCESKKEILAGYKFILCYENSCEDGFISVKLNDAFRARCVPIYFGAPDICNYVPVDCFIDRRNFSDNEQLFDYISTLSESRYNQYLNSIDLYLQSELYSRFTSEYFSTTIINSLKKQKIIPV